MDWRSMFARYVQLVIAEESVDYLPEPDYQPWPESPEFEVERYRRYLEHDWARMARWFGAEEAAEVRQLLREMKADDRLDWSKIRPLLPEDDD